MLGGLDIFGGSLENINDNDEATCLRCGNLNSFVKDEDSGMITCKECGLTKVDRAMNAELDKLDNFGQKGRGHGMAVY